MKLRSLYLLLVFLFPLFVSADDMDGKEYLRKGRAALLGKKYADAITSLLKAEKEYPVLADYALYWLSEAYQGTGRHEESLKTIRTLREKYPDSLLIKNARIREIQESEKISEETLQILYESFLHDYPNETEIKYLYANWLKNHVSADKARYLFKEIYIEAGPYAESAYHELGTSEITVEDLLHRASNLMNKMYFKSAESALRSAMLKDDGTQKKRILEDLGAALFKQKKYKDSAEIYKKIGDRYWEVRSLYRAGEKELIKSVIDELLRSRDNRMASILIAVAADMRRERDFEGAINLYQAILKQHRSRSEDALWGIGWTYYLSEKYKQASEIFSKLYKHTDNTKYLYWKARSLEVDGEISTQIYHDIIEKEDDFYGILSSLRLKGPPEKTGTADEGKTADNFMLAKQLPLVKTKIDRIEALLDLELTQDALKEMIYFAKKADSTDDILYLCTKMHEIRAYNYSMRFAFRLSDKEVLQRFLYPIAYEDIIDSLSKKYSIDPLLILSVVREESRFDTDARSVAGALGLMQLMPETAFRLERKLKLGIDSTHDILNVRNNLHAGSYYLGSLIKEFGSYSYAVAAYNAGEDRVQGWLKKGKYKHSDEFMEDIPYNETKKYVQRVLKTFFEYKRIVSDGNTSIKIPLEKL